MNCPKCGNSIAPNTEFCGNCGAKLTNNAIETLNSNSNISSQQIINNQSNTNQPQIQKQNYNAINADSNGPTQNIKTKKFNPLFIIIPIILLVAGIVCYFNFFNKDNTTDGNKNPDKNASSNSKESTKNTGWDDYSLFIDGNEIKLPMKFSDFSAMGFYEMDTYNESILTETVKAKSNYGDTYNSNIRNIHGLFTNGKTSNINIVIYNDANEEKQLKDCYITGVYFEISARNKDYFTIGEVKVVNNTRKVEATMGKTKYEDIESVFGPHYKYDYTNTLTYYPDLDSDGVISMEDLSFYRALHMFFDNDTRIFDAYDFYLYDTGILEE